MLKKCIDLFPDMMLLHNWAGLMESNSYKTKIKLLILIRKTNSAVLIISQPIPL